MPSRKRTLWSTAAVSAVLLTVACGAGAEESEAPTGDNVATGSTVTIGAITPSVGPTAYPEAGYGIEAAVWYVNNQLGGINGRKLELDLCDGDGTPETAVSCANRFVSAGHPVVFDGWDFSFGGARPALLEAGIPFAGTIAGDPANETVEHPSGFYFTGPLALTAAGLSTVWNALETTSAHFVVVDAPSAHAFVDGALLPLADAAGVAMDVQYADPTTANFNAVAAALMDGDPDMVGAMSMSEDGCTSLFSALRQQGWTGEIFVGSCSKYVEEMSPQEAAGTITMPRVWLPQAKAHAPEEVVKEMDAFEEAMTAVGHKDNIEARAVYAFAGLVTLAEAMGTIEGEITSASVTAALASVEDERMFLGPEMTCDGKQWPKVPTACSSQAIFFTVQEDGSYKPGDPDGFLDVDLGLLGG